VVADGRDVGVDVEHLDRRLPDRALVRRYCSAREADTVDAAGDAWVESFLTYWTLKEAYLKARGLGISVTLADMTFDVTPGASPRVRFEGSLSGEDDRWWFHLWRPAPRHLAAVAVAVPDGRTPNVVVQPFA
jgi:4'-phosphopantetheinyl transferase